MRWSRSDARARRFSRLEIALVTGGCFGCFGSGRRPGLGPAAEVLVLCFAKEKYPKERRPRCPCPPRRGRGGSLRCSGLGCTAELAAFPLRVNSARTTAVSQTTMRVSFGTRSPQALRFSARSEGGGRGLHSGHCFARPGAPSLRSAWAERSRPTRRQRASRASPTPGAAAQQQPSLSPLPTPAGCAEKRRAWGGCVCRRTHALRDLACRSCLNGVRPQGERSEFCGTTPGPSIAGCPRSPDRANGGRRLGVAFSLVTFSWRRKRKLLRRRAHTPAPAPCKGTEHPRAEPSSHPPEDS